MCLDDGILTAYLDAELPEDERARADAHLRDCQACAEALCALESERRVSDRALGALAAAAHAETAGAAAEAPAVLRALRGARPEAAQAEVRELPRARPSWLARVGAGRAAAAAVLVLAAGSLAFAPVRTAAADLLRVFRIEKVQTVSLDYEEMMEIEGKIAGEQGHIDLDELGDAWVTGSQMQREATLAEARSVLGDIAVPPVVKDEPMISLSEGVTYNFKLNVEAVNELLGSLGSTKLLPEEADGETFSIRVPANAMMSFQKTPVSIAQGGAPEIVMPEDVDPEELREVLLSLPILPDDLRRQLQGMDDWMKTLPMPFYGGETRDVEIAGVPCVVNVTKWELAKGEDTNGLPPQSVTIAWVRDGRIFEISAQSTEAEAIGIAESIIR